ncbi:MULTISPECIES: SRPBCC family protein [Phenylobacterium]|uniref:SRPBCC family protein n=1 Tax=Phenylobacterium conjunctum TaxID=1298959 RepID=A0ABW3T3H4_9CAUL
MPFQPGEMFKPSAGFVFGGGGGQAGSGPPKIEHRIGVQAPAEIIWEILADLPSWSAWNPLYPEAAGEIRIGSVLTLRLALPGQPDRMINPVVMEWVPLEQLHWRLSMLGGMVTSVRYIEIEALGPGNCIVSNGEIFTGLLGGLVVGRLRKSIRRGFTEMGEALAARAEARWREQGGAPKSES